MHAWNLVGRLAAGPPVVLDGALGTELERAGVPTGLPLWTTHALLEAPDAVWQIQRSYAEAGAEVLTACTFRTQRRTLERAGRTEPAAAVTRTAVRLARRAARSVGGNINEEGGTPLVAGSAAPLEDCYRPDLAPEREALRREHEEYAQNLADAGVDLILVETMNNVAEARAAARAAAGTGLPFLVSFACRNDGAILSGELLPAGLEAVAANGPAAVLVNCTPPSALGACLPALEGCGLPFGVYPNLGAPAADGAHAETCSPSELVSLAAGWLAAGASLVGGCCGTRPDHIRALADYVARLARASRGPAIRA